jgi:hypothetical protein
LIGGGEVRVTLIKLVPLRCLMPTRMKNCGECNNGRETEAFSDTICSPYFILDVEMVVVVQQLPMCLYELQRLVISVDDCLLSRNVMFPLRAGFHNGIHFFVIGGVFPDRI